MVSEDGTWRFSLVSISVLTLAIVAKPGAPAASQPMAAAR
jgi:hypothetical protein